MNNYFQILSCSSDLGSCCKDKSLAAIISSTSNIVNIIEIIVPILLIISVMIELYKLMSNPEDKKGLSRIKNKLIAAFIVFFIPILVNVSINLVDTNSFDIAACIKESKNIKVNTKTTYKSIDNDERVSIYNDPSKYEKGEKKKTNNNSTYTGQVGTGPISDACTLGDSNVKLVPNDSKKIDSVVSKANGQAVADYAKSWLNKGLTYHFGSTNELTPGGTCDCSHFVYKVLQHFNILKGGQIRSTVWGSCGVKGSVMYSSYDKLVPGDVVFRSFGNAVGHVEIYIGNGETIGCNSGKGVTHGHRAGNYTSFIHLTAYD